MGNFGCWGLSILLHLSPVALVAFFGAALVIDPADLEIRSSSSAPLDIALVRRERTVDFVRPPVETRELDAPDAPLAFEREVDPTPEEPRAPRMAPADAPAPPPDRPLRACPEVVKKPAPAAAASEDRLPSVESETLPVQVHNPPPEYPLPARRRRLEGEVVVEVVVLENGRAGEARVVDGDPDSAFAGSALRAVKDWTFQPATRGGRPVRSVERVRFVFKLAGA